MDDELVERQVAVERIDDPVAIAPGLGQLATGRAGLGVGVVVVGVAGHVEPVPRPALAVGRRGQEPIDDLLERLGRIVREERLDLLRGRRQAGQVERGAADPGPPVRRMRRRACPACFELRQEEAIDLIPRPGDVPRRPAASRSERAGRPTSVAGPRSAGSRRPSSPSVAFEAGHGAPERHPALELRDLAGGQLLLRRHLRFVEIADRPDQQTLVRACRHDSRAAVPPFSSDSRSVSRRPAFAFWSPWQDWHFSTRIGRIDFSKKSSSARAEPCADAMKTSAPEIGRWRPDRRA